jgi:hypothetical protein
MDLTSLTAPAASTSLPVMIAVGRCLRLSRRRTAPWTDPVVRTLMIERAAASMPWRARPLR